MGYQPKYAQKPGRGSASAPGRAGAEKKQPGTRKRTSIWFILLGIVVVPASAAATWMLLNHMFLYLGRPKETAHAEVPDMAISQQFDQHLSGELQSVRNGLLSMERPEEPTEAPPVRKIYWIEEGAQVAPEPNQDCYGQADDPSDLTQVLKEAEYLLDGQPMYFSTETELFQDSVVNYYLDESIFAVTWKEVHDGSVYTFSEIKISHPSQFRRHLAGGEYGSDMQYLTTEMAESVNAVVASSGDFYRFRDFGAVVYEGQARRVEGTYAETCYIDGSGDMHFTYGGEILTVEDAQAYVDENDIQFSLAFGPVLVEDYQVQEHTWYGVGEIMEGYARAALCQMGELHYIVVTANTEGPYQDIPTVATFTQHVAATGCKMAYCLDGGQTAAIVMNDTLINRPVYGQQRKISDIIYFATAVPEGG